MQKVNWTRILIVALAGILGACNVSGENRNEGVPPNPPQYVTLNVEDPSKGGYTVAYQVGSGGWLRFDPNPYHVYTINLQGQDRYGVAVYCNTGEISLIQATGTEVPAPRILCGYPSTSRDYGLYTLYLNLTQTGASVGDSVVVWSRMSIREQAVGDPNSVSVQFASYLEPQDLLVTVVRGGWPPSFHNTEVLSAEVLRVINVTNGGFSVHSLGAPLKTSRVAINGVPSGFDLLPGLFSGVLYLSGNDRDRGGVGFARGGNPFSYREVRGFGQGDRYVLTLHYTDSAQRSFINVLKGFSGGDIAITLPMPWSPNSLSVTSEAHPTISGLNRVEPKLRGYGLLLEAGGYRYQTLLSKGWLGSSTAYKVPDLQTLLGYTPPGTRAEIKVWVTALISSDPLLGVVRQTTWFLPILDDPSAITATLEAYSVGAGGGYSVGQGGGVRFP